MSTGSEKKEKRAGKSLFRFLAENYVYFTALNLLILAILYLGFRFYSKEMLPGAEAGQFLEQAAQMDDGTLAETNYRKYLGREAEIALLDETGAVLFPEGAEGYGEQELACIAEYGATDRLFLAQLPGEGNGYLLTRSVYQEDGTLSVSGYARLDGQGRRRAGTLFPEKKAFSQREMAFLRGEGGQGRKIYKYTYENPAGQQRTLVFRFREPGPEEFAKVYSVLGGAKWIFIPVYLGTAVFCIWWLGRRTRRLLDPISDATIRLSGGQPSGLEHYEGPREFAKLADNFVRMEQRLKESEAERRRLDGDRRRLLADISHDLKTPATVIRGYAAALRDNIVPQGERERYLDTIAAKSEQLGELLLAFHEYSKLEHPEMPVNREKADLGSAVREYFADRYHELEPSGYPVEADIPETPLWCLLDRKLFSRALDNLVSNAVRYNPPGTTLFVRVTRDDGAMIGADGTMIRADGEMVRADGAMIQADGPTIRGKGVIKVSVGDDGRGIPPEIRGNLFEPFVTGDAARSDGHGSGLGLSICRQIARLHGGELALAEEPSPGWKTEFYFLFPEA